MYKTHLFIQWRYLCTQVGDQESTLRQLELRLENVEALVKGGLAIKTGL